MFQFTKEPGDPSNNDTVTTVGNQRMSIEVQPTKPCVAIYMGPHSLSKSQTRCLLTYAEHMVMPEDYPVEAKDLLLAFVDILCQSQVPAHKLFVPSMFTIDLELYLLLAQLTGLKPFKLAELSHLCDPETVHSSRLNYAILDDIIANNDHAKRLIAYIKNIATPPMGSDGGSSTQTQRIINPSVCMGSNRTHRCYTCEQLNVEEGVHEWSHLYPKEILIYSNRINGAVFFCPAYPGINYAHLVQGLVESEAGLDDLTFEALYEQSSKRQLVPEKALPMVHLLPNAKRSIRLTRRRTTREPEILDVDERGEEEVQRKWKKVELPEEDGNSMSDDFSVETEQ